MSGPKKKKSKAAGKSGRPRGLSKEERLALEKDIMGIFDPGRRYQPLSCRPTEEQIAGMSREIAAAQGRVPTSDEVRKLLQDLERQTSSEAIVAKRKKALLKLGFFRARNHPNLPTSFFSN